MKIKLIGLNRRVQKLMIVVAFLCLTPWTKGEACVGADQARDLVGGLYKQGLMSMNSEVRVLSSMEATPSGGFYFETGRDQSTNESFGVVVYCDGDHDLTDRSSVF